MKKSIFIAVFAISLTCYAQIGINTIDPAATLDVSTPDNYSTGKLAGISFPQLTGNQIEEMVTTSLKSGTLVYATSASTNAQKDIDAIGYWYWTGDSNKKWEPLFLSHKSVVSYFYAPSIVLPTSSLGISTDQTKDISFNTSNNTFRIDLYKIYENQFSMNGETATIKSAVKNPSASSLPTFEKNLLDYYITYFDNTVFDPTSVAITNDGILTYRIINNPHVTENTFMNIVYKVK